MIELLRTWLFGLTAVSVLLSLAETLVSQEGIRRVLRLAGGVLMILILLQPLTRIDPSELEISLDDYRQEASDLRESYARQQQEELAAGIAAELDAYIWDKARELGLDCRAHVTVEIGADGTAFPRSVTVEGPYSPALSEIIETDLGIPEENQKWQEAA